MANLPSGPANLAKLRSCGTLSSMRVRWAGWSPSWLVPRHDELVDRFMQTKLEGSLLESTNISGKSKKDKDAKK